MLDDLVQRVQSRWHDEGRAVSPVIAVILLVAIVVILSAVLAMTSMQIAPDDGYTSQPQGSFEYERADGKIKIYPTQINNDAKFDLVVQGKTIYSWEGSGATDVRELECLYPGDTIRIVNDAGEKTYVNSEWEVESPTDCPMDGSTEERFATVVVNDNEEPIFAPQYEFTLKVAPDQNADSYDEVNTDNVYPVTNQWHYVERYDRPIEGYEPPVYVIVLADNAQYGQSPDEVGEEVVKSYSIDEDGNVVVEASSDNEPTNDVYMVFRPGCDNSKLKFIEERAGYDNTIILGDEVIIDNTNEEENGNEYNDISGVECLDPAEE